MDIELVRTTIHVADIIPAELGQSARVVGDDGVIYGCWPNKLGGLRVGESYDADVHEKQKNGVIYRDIKTLRHIGPSLAPRPLSAAVTPPKPPESGGADYDAPQPARRDNDNGMAYYRRKPTDPQDAERMFCTKILGDLIMSHQIKGDDVDALTRAVNQLREVWRDTFGRNA